MGHILLEIKIIINNICKVPNMVGTEGNLAAAAVSITTTMMIVVLATIRSLFRIHYHIFGCSVLNERK